MKKVIFVILALCFAGSLALAGEAAKPADEKAMATEAAPGVVVVSDEAKDKTDAIVATEEVKDEATLEKEAADKAAADKLAAEKVDTTAKK